MSGNTISPESRRLHIDHQNDLKLYKERVWMSGGLQL